MSTDSDRVAGVLERAYRDEWSAVVATLARRLGDLQAAEDAEMLVVSSRGVGGFKRLRVGSVATQLTHHAHCPVVVIPVDDV